MAHRTCIIFILYYSSCITRAQNKKLPISHCALGTRGGKLVTSNDQRITIQTNHVELYATMQVIK